MKNPKRPGDIEMAVALKSLGIMRDGMMIGWHCDQETICEYMDRQGYWPLGGAVGIIASRLSSEDKHWRDPKRIRGFSCDCGAYFSAGDGTSGEVAAARAEMDADFSMHGINNCSRCR